MGNFSVNQVRQLYVVTAVQGTANKTDGVVSATAGAGTIALKTDKEGKVTITTIGIYEKHKLVMTIDIEYDKNGNVIPYFSGGKKTTHAHKWPTDNSSGKVGRKPHNPKNVFSYGHKYDELLKKIVEFSKKGKVWKQ